MQELERIREQLQRAWTGPAWHGPAVREILEGVDAARAAALALPGRHSIWEIVLHIACWEDAVRRRAQGEAVDPTPEQDWPAVGDVSAPAWQKTLAALERGHLSLVEAVAALDAARLDTTAPGCDYTVGFMLHGVVQHDLYHAGQIALLKAAAA